MEEGIHVLFYNSQHTNEFYNVVALPAGLIFFFFFFFFFFLGKKKKKGIEEGEKTFKKIKKYRNSTKPQFGGQ